MGLVPMAELLERACRGRFAIPSFCVWNLETAAVVLDAATRLRAPVVVMAGPSEFALTRPGLLAGTIRGLMEERELPVALHLDHGDSPGLVDECQAAGFTSVMLDYSAREYDQNVEALREVVERARPLNVTVEGEIGHVGRADTITNEGESDSTLTDPHIAAAYVEATRVDALAISIGNAHGQYTRLPQLDFDRLASIARETPTPLVLHGGSGTPDHDIRQAISFGIRKVNVATELVVAFRDSLLRQWKTGENLWAPTAQARAVEAMLPVVERWINLTGAAGRA